MTALTDRFTRTVDYARLAQVRKGSEIPYLYYPLAVASLVIEFGGNEDQAIAGLLHDVVEDCGQAMPPIIRARFGDEVATNERPLAREAGLTAAALVVICSIARPAAFFGRRAR
jgi:hypothetical protein